MAEIAENMQEGLLVGVGVQVMRQEANCLIFRHGSFKSAGNPPIPPHSSQAECDGWVSRREIDGCGKPFRIVLDSPPGKNHHVEKCDYI